MELNRGWKRSGRCTCGSCFEWLELSDCVILRDSKTADVRDQPTIMMGRETWAAFQAHFAAHSDGLVASARFESVTVTQGAIDGWIDVTDVDTSVTLSFDADEVKAFAAGILTQDFIVVG